MSLRFLIRGLKARHRDHRAELGSLVSALRRGEVAIDVGANKGSFLPALARAVGPSGTVFAFEPQPDLVAPLRRECPPNAEIEACGVSDRPGRMALAIPLGRDGAAVASPGASFAPEVARRERCRTIEVPVVALDERFADESRRIGAIKIDVEGHELAVLRGAERIVERHRPAIVCECEARHLDDGAAGVAAVLAWFRARAYAGSFVRGGRLHPIDRFDIVRDQPTEGDRFWDRPDYCNNFVFRPG
jgi:FkbM family methyltransferase